MTIKFPRRRKTPVVDPVANTKSMLRCFGLTELQINALSNATDQPRFMAEVAQCHALAMQTIAADPAELMCWFNRRNVRLGAIPKQLVVTDDGLFKLIRYLSAVKAHQETQS